MMERNFGRAKTGFILLFGVAFLFLPILEATATHLRAGQITVTRENPASRMCHITVTVYTDIDCPQQCVLFGGPDDWLDFGDGTRVLIPEQAATPLAGVDGVGKVSYSYDYEYRGNGSYIISYIEPNRNGGVLNMDNSLNTTFYIETRIDLSVLGRSKSPVFDVDPIDVACVGVAFFHNPGAYDPDQIDSLSYELVIPFSDRATVVKNYRDPNHPGFYTGLDYNNANETADSLPTFSINSVNGILRWDAPGKAGEYNIAFIVKEWRKIQGVWAAIGFVRRDMQIIVVDCNNERPTLIIPNDTCIVAGTTLNATIFGLDDTPNLSNPGNLPDHHPVKIEAFSEIFATSFPSRATVQPNPPVFQPSNPPAELEFTWNTTCGHVKDQAYQVVFKISDNPQGDGPSLVTFEAWRIKVIAPAPVLETATVILPQRHVELEWEPYACYQEASKMEVWRRVAETNFTPDSCQTGMPESLGFTLIETINLDVSGSPITTYTDTNGGKGLEANAQYCYRLVAVYPLPKGGESRVSNEKCIAPILTSEPVITEVSVIKTGETAGDIRIKWLRPLLIDTIQFPKPHEFQVQRATATGFLTVSTKDTVTTFTDSFLNTYDDQYFYRVLLYSSAFTNPIDTSSLASSVWLELSPQKSKIRLNWSAVVPWSNQLQDYPMHDIYRGPEGADESAMVFIDSVNVLQDGFTYLDEGKRGALPGDSLNGNQTYCYRIMTRGGYGNINIPEPLKNFSQINCAMPVDEEKPCKPTIQAFINSCENFLVEYACDANSFTNVVRWSVPEGVCKDDVKSYKIYFSPVKNGAYGPIASATDTFYVHSEQGALKGCYRITAIDRSGNESDMSNPVCNDNCPYYELPNVFSPNGDNCNDLFRAFGDDINLDCNDPGPEKDDRCARFVQKVDFTVYNRWGKKVYNYLGQVGDEDTIYIRWDGRDEKGRELAAAVYFYVAEVTFDVVDPADRVKIIKGWVHLVR